MRNILLVFFVLVISSCASRRPAPLEVVEKVQDTIYIENTTVVRDTVLLTQLVELRDTITLEVAKNQVKPFVQVTKKDNATLQLWSKDNAVFADCKCDTIKIAAQLTDKVQKKNETKVITKTVVLPAPPAERYVPWFVKILAWIGTVALVYHGGRLALNTTLPFKFLK